MLESLGKVMLFPYSREMLALYKFREMLPFEIQSVVSVKSWGYVGKNAGAIDGGEPGPHIVIGDFAAELHEVDSVILGSFSKYFAGGEILEVYLREVYAAGKNALVLAPVDRDLVARYEALFSARGQKFLAIYNQFEQEHFPRLLSVPVLGVFGAAEGTGKLEMQVEMYRTLTLAGYRVQMIGANPQIALLGGYTYPSALYREKVDENQKVRILRTFANSIVAEDQPDILVISAPYGMHNFEEDRWGIDMGKNGLLAHLIIEALKPDANLFCMMPGDIKWSKRCLDTVATLSAAPTLAVATRRLLSTPINAYERFKYSLMDEEMFDLHLEIWREHLHPVILDLEKLSEATLLQLIENAFAAEQRLESLI